MKFWQFRCFVLLFFEFFAPDTLNTTHLKNLFSSVGKHTKRDKRGKIQIIIIKTLLKTHITLNMAASMQSISFARSTAGSTSSLRRKNVAPRRIVNTQAQAKVRLKIGD
jgi:hypothetical protein